MVDIEPGTKVKVQVDFKDIILQDNEEDGTLTGDVRFILYKGDHYHLTVSSDWGEDIFVDTNDVWDNGDHVGISIFPESIKINSCSSCSPSSLSACEDASASVQVQKRRKRIL